ncbi:MAG: hypothetical protein PHR56_00370 [Dehalococcoidales bacterium]|nr:hypothetical protein [Dehalococcoidales bacterium]
MVKRKLDSWNIGQRRVEKIKEWERKQGNRAESTGMYSDGADILVYRGNELIRVYESTNYKKPEFYIQQGKADRYMRNLLQYPPSVQKILVCSYEKNLEKVGGKAFFTQFGIQVRIIGYQD